MKTLITVFAIILLSFGVQQGKEVAQAPENTYTIIGEAYDHIDMAILLNEKLNLDQAYQTQSPAIEFEFRTLDNQAVYFIYNSITKTFSQVDSIKAESLIYNTKETTQEFSELSQVKIPHYYNLDCSSIGCVWSNGTSSLLMTHTTAAQYYNLTKYIQ